MEDSQPQSLKADDKGKTEEKQINLKTYYCPPKHLFMFPNEVLERVLGFLGPKDFLRLKDTSKAVEHRVRSLLYAKRNRGELFWKKACIPDLKKDYNLRKIIASFYTCLEEGKRSQLEAEARLFSDWPRLVSARKYWWQSEDTNGMELPLATFECAYEIDRKLIARLSFLPVKQAQLKDVERMIKEQFSLSYFAYQQYISETWPKIIISTCGSTLYYFMSPAYISQYHNLYFYENMSSSRRVMRIRDYTKTSCRVVTLPSHFDEYEANCDTSLPKIDSILILQQNFGLTIVPVHEGLPTYLRPEWGPEVSKIQLPYAVCGRFLAVFQNPTEIHIYEMVRGTKGITMNNYKTYVVEELRYLWSLLTYQDHSKFFAMNLRYGKIVSSESESDFCVVVPDDDEIVFQAFSPEFCMTIGDGSFISLKKDEMAYSNYELHEEVPHSEMEVLYDFDTLLYWSTNVLGYLCLCEEWVINRWRDNDSKIKSVSLLEIIAPETIMFTTNYDDDGQRELYIVIAKMEVKCAFGLKQCTALIGSHQSSSKVWPRIIRKIPIELCKIFDPRLIITHMKFDFDKGKPYIFIVAKREFKFGCKCSHGFRDGDGCNFCSPGQQDTGSFGLKFKILKITFEDLNSEKKYGELDSSAVYDPNGFPFIAQSQDEIYDDKMYEEILSSCRLNTNDKSSD